MKWVRYRILPFCSLFLSFGSPWHVCSFLTNLPVHAHFHMQQVEIWARMLSGISWCPVLNWLTCRLFSVGINCFNCNQFGLIPLAFLNRTLFQPFLGEMRLLMWIVLTWGTIMQHNHRNAFSLVHLRLMPVERVDQPHQPIEHENTQPTRNGWSQENMTLMMWGLFFSLKVLAEWNKGELDSFLIEITKDILAYKDSDGEPLVEKIRDSAGQVKMMLLLEICTKYWKILK